MMPLTRIRNKVATGFDEKVIGSILDKLIRNL